MTKASEEVVVYTTATCGWALRVYAALLEAGVPFRLVDVKSGDEAAAAAWRRDSPYARTPAIRHGDTAIWESWAIAAYVDRAFPEAGIGARDPVEQALADLWMWHCDREVFPLLTALAKADDAERPERREALTAALQRLEHPAFDAQRIAPFWGGDRLSLVDIGYQVLFDTVKRAPEWAGEAIDTPEWFRTWSDAVGAHPTILSAQALALDLRKAA